MESVTRIISIICLLNIGSTIAQDGSVATTGPPAPKPNPYFFNTSDVRMEMSGPMRLNFYEVVAGPKIGQLIERIDVNTTVVPVVNSTSGPGVNSTTVASINVAYTGVQSHGSINNLSVLNDAAFHLEFSVDNIKWTLITVSTTGDGQLMNGTTAKPFSGEKSLRPFIKTGYSPSPVDTAYGRGYTTGSPSKKLSWYCDRQEFSEDPSAKTVGDFIIGLEFPGFQVQPLVNSTINGTKFGYSWNCDPLVSAKIWEIVFIVLILAFIFLWSVQMMLNLNTPTRYDDPKGKPLTVPLHE